MEHVTIAGGGIAGLATAIGLAGKGFAVRIVEQARFFSNVGAGIQIGPNAVRALQEVGAWDAVEPLTVRPPLIKVMSGTSGKALQTIDLGRVFEQRYGAPYRVMHRSDLHAALLNCAQRSQRIVVDMGKDAACEFDQRTEHTGCLIAADGVRSPIRGMMFPGAEASQLAFTIHRTMLPPKALARFTDRDCVHVWLYPGGHIVHYPVRSGHINVVAVSNGIDASLPARFVSELFGDLASTASWSEWPALIAPPLDAWHLGNVCLIGDAAHGTMPFLAQGAAMALEDAAALAEIFSTQQQVSERFTSFETQRRKRTQRLHHQNLAMARLYHLKGMAELARNAVFRMSPRSAPLRSVDWIYRRR